MRNNNIATFKIEMMDVGGKNPSEIVDPKSRKRDWNDFLTTEDEVKYHSPAKIDDEEWQQMLATKAVGAKIAALDVFDEAA